MSRKLASTIIALCASFLSVNALADTFAGKVLDGEGAPLIGAVVRIPDMKETAVTDGDGCFRFILKTSKPVKASVSYVVHNRHLYTETCRHRQPADHTNVSRRDSSRRSGCHGYPHT